MCLNRFIDNLTILMKPLHKKETLSHESSNYDYVELNILVQLLWAVIEICKIVEITNLENT